MGVGAADSCWVMVDGGVSVGPRSIAATPAVTLSVEVEVTGPETTEGEVAHDEGTLEEAASEGFDFFLVLAIVFGLVS